MKFTSHAPASLDHAEECRSSFPLHSHTIWYKAGTIMSSWKQMSLYVIYCVLACSIERGQSSKTRLICLSFTDPLFQFVRANANENCEVISHDRVLKTRACNFQKEEAKNEKHNDDDDDDDHSDLFKVSAGCLLSAASLPVTVKRCPRFNPL